MAFADQIRRGRGDPMMPRPRGEAASRQWRARPAFLANWNPPPPGNDDVRPIRDTGPASELDCLRGVLAPGLLRAAEWRGRQLDIGADQVLIRWGVIDEDAYLRRLAFDLDIAIDTLAQVDCSDTLLLDRQIPSAAEFGLILLRRDGQTIWTLAPRHLASRTLCHLVARFRDVKPRLRITSASSLQQFLTQQGGKALADVATDTLRRKFPTMSAAPARRRGPPWRQRVERGAVVTTLLLLPPVVLLEAWSTMMALWFLAFGALRLAACFWPRPTPATLARLPDHQLPVYTVIAALYREANSVAPLLQAIDALDYPREKLDVILVVEPNDLQTRAAIARLRPLPHIRLLIAPAVAPQTKPKALNCALPFVRGSFVAVTMPRIDPSPASCAPSWMRFASVPTTSPARRPACASTT